MKKKTLALASFLLLLSALGLAQASAAAAPRDLSGMYTFLHEGEFVQLQVEDGHVGGVVSHFRNEDLEKAEFVDQFLDEAKLQGSALSFRTKVADGSWFEFSGSVQRGNGKTPADEGYWELRGTLFEKHKAADGNVTEKRHELVMKSFPQDEAPAK